VDLIKLIQDGVQQWDFLNTVTNLRVHQKLENSLPADGISAS